MTLMILHSRFEARPVGGSESESTLSLPGAQLRPSYLAAKYVLQMVTYERRSPLQRCRARQISGGMAESYHCTTSHCDVVCACVKVAESLSKLS
jgi:hypothetical protein